MIVTRSLTIWPILLTVALLTFAAEVSAADPSPIVIDRWWNTDYSKQWCNGIPDKDACRDRMVRAYDDYEIRLKSAFATMESCTGLELVTTPKRRGEVEMTNRQPFWNLMIYFADQKPSQEWRLLLLGMPTMSFDGTNIEATGTVSEIAQQVCTVVKNRGAKVD